MTLGNRGPDELPLRIFGKHRPLIGLKLDRPPVVRPLPSDAPDDCIGLNPNISETGAPMHCGPFGVVGARWLLDSLKLHEGSVQRP
jgi:hypothetical protein